MWNDVKAYLSCKKEGWILFLVFHVVFALIFFLYQFPVEGACYGIAVNLVLWLMYQAADFGRFRRRFRQLKGIQTVIAVDDSELPESQDALESVYQELLHRLFEEKAQEVSKADADFKNQLEYATMWAHQIKTPIAAMGLLLQEEDTEKNRELAMELFEIEQYVDMILQYQRLRNISGDLVFREYDLDEILRQCIRKYARSFIRKRLSLDFRETGRKVVTDEKWLSVVIGQILSNSLKYTKSGSIRIFMEGDYLVIEDTGIGIAPEDLPRVFEKGYTGYNGRNDKKSTGIGLYLCREILEKLSHEIKISSAPGKGTKVSLKVTREQLEVE